MKKALKAKETVRLNVVRMLISEIKNEAVSAAEKKRTPEEVVAAYLKKLSKAKAEFSSRADYVAGLDAEIKVVEEFLPKMMSKDEIIAFIKSNVTDVQMKTVMPLLKGKADGKLIADIIANWK
jgi:hypothetical protein